MIRMSSGTTTRARSRWLLGGVALLSAGLLLVPVPTRWQSQWFHVVMDLAHLPLFAAATLACLATGMAKMPTILGVALLAALAEIAQLATGRSGDVGDWFRGLAGIAIGACLFDLVQVRLPPMARAARIAAIAILAGFPAWAAYPTLRGAWGALAVFPRLTDFSDPYQIFQWQPYQAEAKLVRDGDRPALRVKLADGPARYSGVEFRPVMRDWTGWRRLCIEIAAARDVQLFLSLRDSRAESEYHDRFNWSGRIGPEGSTIQIDLARVAAAPRGPPLDLSAVRFLNLYIPTPKADCVIWIRNIRLE